MFIKPFTKYNKATRERYTVYELVESYRKNGSVCHHIFVNFGRLESLETVEQKKLLASRVLRLLTNGGNVLSTSITDQCVEELARYYFNEIKNKKRYDLKQGIFDRETVNLSTLKNNDAREICDLTNMYFEGRMRAVK